jgi:hypothetical protein
MEEEIDLNFTKARDFAFGYFCRHTGLIIEEFRAKGSLYNYLIDITEDDLQTGRFLAVVTRSEDDIDNDEAFYGRMKNQYKNFAIPAVLIVVDPKNERGRYRWIKKPLKNRQLEFNPMIFDLEPLKKKTIHKIVEKTKNWYSLNYPA